MTQPSANPRGADVLVAAMKQTGVRRVFTLSGNHIMPLYDALFGSGIELVHVRHEAAAVHMADAWSRITGQIGIALVTGGPGHANAVGALYTAAMAEAPVLLLSGHAPNRELGMGSFQEMRQADIAAPLTKEAWTCASAADIAADFARAVRTAYSGRPGPVHLSLPVDTLEGPCHAAPLPADAFAPTRQSLDNDALIAIVSLLAAASRPLILTGPITMTRSGRAALRELETATGIPVIGMESPRGIADPSLGAFPQLLARADCVLLLGKRCDFTLKFGAGAALAADCAFMQVESDEAERKRTALALGTRLRDAFSADALAAIEQLTQWNNAQAATLAGWRDEARAAITYRPPAWDQAKADDKGRLHPVQALRPLQALLDSHPDAVFVSDGGEFGQWAQACLNAPHRLINGVAGAIGASLPYALAARAAVGADAPVVAAMGDGTFGFHASEIDTAVRCGLPALLLIGNDARWNAEYQIQLRDYGADRLIGCELEPTRYDQVCTAFGGHGELVADAAALNGAVKRAVASGKVSCLNVMIQGLPAPQVKR